MNLWLEQFAPSVPAEMEQPADLARFELNHAGICANLIEKPDMGDAYRIDPGENNSYILTGGQTGLLYAAYRLITSRLCGESLNVSVSSAPKYALRMVNCWDNMNGEIERGYSGNSLFFINGRLEYNTERIRTLGRLLASSGLNVLCVNNVNVHDPVQRLLEVVDVSHGHVVPELSVVYAKEGLPLQAGLHLLENARLV